MDYDRPSYDEVTIVNEPDSENAPNVDSDSDQDENCRLLHNEPPENSSCGQGGSAEPGPRSSAAKDVKGESVGPSALLPSTQQVIKQVAGK